MTDAGEMVTHIVFLCEYADGQAHSKSAEEVEAVYWITSEELLQYPSAPPWTKESIRRAEEARQHILIRSSL
ncbi:DNA mismatch repair protein MutT [Paenibacillus sp. Z6-24]